MKERTSGDLGEGRKINKKKINATKRKHKPKRTIEHFEQFKKPHLT
jgi:hypothetical protein